ncbi:MAG TPA: asparagine synthase-related protein [Planctomycetota bacterium]|nr:asparagine synthase-related protein [Planctomycetota bacterium]
MKLLEPVLFRDGCPVSRMEFDEGLDPKQVIAAHAGHFAIHYRFGSGEHLLARDLLGVHKLFFAVGCDGHIEAANYFVDLLRAGYPAEQVFSVPSGHYLLIHPDERRYSLQRWGAIRFGRNARARVSEHRLDVFATAIRAALERTFRMLAKRFDRRPVYVTLSGGLDSTTIAAFAREHFANVHAVTFALKTPRLSDRGSDLFFARRVASDLGLPLIEVIVDPEEVLELLDDVLVYGQDWRDFNVHCGLVNAALGRALCALHERGPRPVVLTGDTMNELLADYSPVSLGGKEYYGLPRIDKGAVRRFLVKGLDSGDREVGIFARFGVDTVQPYAMCAKEYAALPHDLVCSADFKARAVRAVMGSIVPESVYRRPKVRAQVAVDGLPGGILALLIACGIDQRHLKRRFARLLAMDSRSVHGMFRGGLYRFSTVFPGAESA